VNIRPCSLRSVRNITNLYSGRRWEIVNIRPCSLRSVRNITNLYSGSRWEIVNIRPCSLRSVRNITNLYSGNQWEIVNILQCSLRSVHDITNLHLTNNRELTHVLRKSEQFLLNWLHPLCYSNGYRFCLFLRFSVWFWTCTDIVVCFIISKRVLSFCRNFTNQYIPLV
jgi:hypothetical protein